MLVAWCRLGRGGQADGLPICRLHLGKPAAGLLRIRLLAACCIYAMQILPFQKLDLHATWGVSVVGKEKKSHAKSFRRQ